MSKVFFVKTSKASCSDTRCKATKRLLKELEEREGVKFAGKIPLKVHFGEKGNSTYIKSENYDGIIEFLNERNIESCYIETNVLYGGQRGKRDLHLKTASEHGFKQLPIVIADGESGEAYEEVEINKKHFNRCKIGRVFLDYEQIIVLSHFKGHFFAGFGGAIKQLSMGFASKGGKLAMHMGLKPRIVNRKCRRCGLCEKRCNENAISIGKKSFIDHEKCLGCGACVSICPHKAISIFSVRGILRAFGIGNPFREKLIEYAYAAQKDKKHIYLNFAINITKGCDCESRKMKPLMDDIGIFASTDPVAIDKACYDEVAKRGKRFRGIKQFDYAEKTGLGSTDYELIEI